MKFWNFYPFFEGIILISRKIWEWLKISAKKYAYFTRTYDEKYFSLYAFETYLFPYLIKNVKHLIDVFMLYFWAFYISWFLNFIYFVLHFWLDWRDLKWNMYQIFFILKIWRRFLVRTHFWTTNLGKW